MKYLFNGVPDDCNSGTTSWEREHMCYACWHCVTYISGRSVLLPRPICVGCFGTGIVAIGDWMHSGAREGVTYEYVHTLIKECKVQLPTQEQQKKP